MKSFNVHQAAIQKLGELSKKLIRFLTRLSENDFAFKLFDQRVFQRDFSILNERIPLNHISIFPEVQGGRGYIVVEDLVHLKLHFNYLAPRIGVVGYNHHILDFWGVNLLHLGRKEQSAKSDQLELIFLDGRAGGHVPIEIVNRVMQRFPVIEILQTDFLNPVYENRPHLPGDAVLA